MTQGSQLEFKLLSKKRFWINLFAQLFQKKKRLFVFQMSTSTRRYSSVEVLRRVEAIGARGGRLEGAAGTVGVDLYSTRATRVLGLTRAGACGNGVCEVGETCVGPADEATAPDAGNAAVAAATTRSANFGSFSASLRAVSDGVATGAGLRGPAAAAAAATCCPADCPHALRPCPAPPGRAVFTHKQNIHAIDI